MLSDPKSLLQVAGGWWIVIDNYAEDPFLPQTSLQIMRAGDFKKIPYISGTMASEGGEVVAQEYDNIEEIGQNWDSMGASFNGLTFNQDPELFTEE